MILGLTGGIGTGKSSVSRIFSELGAQVVDADKMSQEIFQSECSDEIYKIFGTLDRAIIKEKVFNDPLLLQKINEIIHPRVIARLTKIKNENDKIPSKIVVFDIPLLFEAKLEYLCDEILSIICARENQIERVMKRNKMFAPLVEKIIDAQAKNGDRIIGSDHVIENNGTIIELREKVSNLYKDIKSRWIAN
ncbi:MAG: dephospho-CoA kinase [Fusobacteriaceae bacterium]